MRRTLIVWLIIQLLVIGWFSTDEYNEVVDHKCSSQEHLSRSKYSIIAPTRSTTVDHVRPQKYRSAVVVNSDLADSLVITGAATHSEKPLPLWPVWLCLALYVAFVIIVFVKGWRVPSKQSTKYYCGRFADDD